LRYCIDVRSKKKIGSVKKFDKISSFARVARWFNFIPNIQIFVHFGRPLSEAFWYNLWKFGKFYCHWVYFCDRLTFSWSFGIFFPLWNVAPRKIWQPWFFVQKIQLWKDFYLIIYLYYLSFFYGDQ
jgi:hypothetical protein